MTAMYRYPVKTKWGIFQLLFSEKGLTRIRFPGRGRFRTSAPRPPHEIAPTLRRAVRCLQGYLKTARVRDRGFIFDESKWSKPFRRMASELRRIPSGTTRSYGWLARRCGCPKGSRAMGTLLGSNPLPIFFPCHRIVRSDGTLGGFNAGVAWKRKLLGHESGSKQKGRLA